MTLTDLALHMLKYIGITSLTASEGQTDANQRGLVDGDIADVAMYITGGLQDLYAQLFGDTPYSDVLRPPTQVTLNCTQFSKSITGLAGSAAWMDGCTIRIDGDNDDNELITTATARLRRPYMGTTGAKTARVFGDAMLLPEAYRNIIEPVVLPGICLLSPASSKEEFRRYSTSEYDGAAALPSRQYGAIYASTQNKIVAQPLAWFADTRSNLDDGVAFQVFLRVAPMPDRAYPVDFQTRRVPTSIAAVDITGDDDTLTTQIPAGMMESIMAPMALKRFTAHPAFNNTEAAAEIDRQYRLALAQLEALKPQISRRLAKYH